MDQVLLMGELQRPRQIDADAHHRLPVELACFFDAANDGGKAVARNVLRRHPAMAAGLARAIDFQQMRMTERQHRLHRLDETRHLLFVLPEIGA